MTKNHRKTKIKKKKRESWLEKSDRVIERMASKEWVRGKKTKKLLRTIDKKVDKLVEWVARQSPYQFR